MSNVYVTFEPSGFLHQLALKKIEGKPLLYYVGDLAGDCAPWDRDHTPDKCKRAKAMRLAAWDAYAMQKCHLLQRRVVDNIFEYWAYPGKNVVPPLCNEDLKYNYHARMNRGGICTPAMKRGGIPYAIAA